MAKTYLLSTGDCTTKLEYYILDLIRLNLRVLPGDIPRSDIGFDFTMIDVQNQNLTSEISRRVDTLISKIKGQFNAGLMMSVDSVDLIDNSRVRIVVTVNQVSDDIEIDL